MTPDLSIVIPVYNEQTNIPELFRRVSDVLAPSGKSYEFVFVNDGSSDDSEKILTDLHQTQVGKVRVVQFARNFGHQLALTAGLDFAQGKAVIVMDADLQDPPEVVLQFLQKWDEGYKIVYGVRTAREGETIFKKWTAAAFYKLLRSLAKIDIPANVGDFYLLDEKIVKIFRTMKERHRFIRGLVAWVGFKKIGVPYVRKPRFAGTTKYTLWKMITFSFDALTSFSFAPLRFVSFLGAVFSIVSFLSILIIFYEKLFTDVTVTGWSSLMAVILFIGGIQLLSIGVIGEYIARIGDDVKARPLYTVEDVLE
jgi:polyisoprenyl-phosphate glycosyltransferase